MSANSRRCLVLVMRRGLGTQIDHVQTMLDMAVEIHLVTSETTGIHDDARFASVISLPKAASIREFVDVAVRTAKEQAASAVVTFNETEIEIAETANAELGLDWARVEAAYTCRDKLKQRVFLRDHDIPTVWFHPVSDIQGAVDAAAKQGYPLIVKPTRAAASEYVELVHDETRLAAALTQIENMIAEKRGHYYDQVVPENWAILEEFLPGQEVTMDGVVLNGDFILGGVHNKMDTQGPFFDEDLYTLPFSHPEREAELAGIARAIITALGMRTCLFNAELRADADGAYRIVEFSIRMSGGHPYRHIRDVYAIDLVRMYVRAVCGDPVADIIAQENHRQEPRMTVCAKVVYAEGQVIRNSVGEALHSPYFRVYYPVARPGSEVRSGTRGFDYTGLLSVWMPWKPGDDPSVVHTVARDLATKLDVEISDDRQPETS
jgi:biotin carboxylase